MRHASPAKTVGVAGTVDGAAPITRGKIEMTRTGIVCNTNAASARPPLRGVRHGCVITITMTTAAQNTTPWVRSRPRANARRAETSGCSEKCKASTDVAEIALPADFVRDQQQRDGGTRAKLGDRKDAPIAVRVGRRQSMTEASPQPFDEIEREHDDRGECGHGQQKIDRRAQQRLKRDAECVGRKT